MGLASSETAMFSSGSRLARALVCLVSAACAGAALAQAPDEPAPTGAQAPAPPANQRTRATRSTTAVDIPNERQLAVWAGYGKSDNLARTAVAPIDGSYESVGLLLALGHDAERIDASINSDLEFRTYSEQSIDDETVGTLDAKAVFSLAPERVSWLIDENFGQGLRDAFAPVGPNNRESFNVVSTGPRLDLPLGARTNLEMTGLYSSRRYDQSNGVDTDSVAYELGVFRQATATARFGLVANTNDIDYTNVDAPSYRIDRFSLRYDKRLASGRVRADAGKNEISSSGRTDDEPFFDFEWTRALSGRSDLTITATREFTDSGNQLATTTPGSGTGASDILVTPNPLEEKRLNASYTVRMPRTSLSAGVGATNDRYVSDSTFDNDGTTVTLGLSHTISARLGIGLNYNSTRRDFTDPAHVSDQDRTTSAWLNRSLGRKFGVAFGISRYARRGSQNFDENHYEVRFDYSPTGSATTAMRNIGR